MSHVNLKNCQCHMSVRVFPPMLPVVFKKRL